MNSPTLAKLMLVCLKIDPKYANNSCCYMAAFACLHSIIRPPWLKTTGSMRTGAAAVHSMQRLSTQNSARR